MQPRSSSLSLRTLSQVKRWNASYADAAASIVDDAVFRERRALDCRWCSMISEARLRLSRTPSSSAEEGRIKMDEEIG